MIRKKLLIILTAVLMGTLACSISFDLPVDEITTGETVTEPINIKLPSGTPEVNLTFGAGELEVKPGDTPGLITGSATYNVKDLKPVVEVEDEQVTISTGNFEITGIPNVDQDIENDWKLAIGNSPLELKINAGAYKGKYELGGLAIRSLEVADGASNVSLAFSKPNLVEMETFRYITGASDLELEGLANANFASMTFRGGAGDFKLDFSGILRREATVHIESGLSRVELVIPQAMSARVIFRGGLTSINASSAWEKSREEYVHTGEGPTITIFVEMAAGELKLSTY